MAIGLTDVMTVGAGVVGDKDRLLGGVKFVYRRLRVRQRTVRVGWFDVRCAGRHVGATCEKYTPYSGIVGEAREEVSLCRYYRGLRQWHGVWH